MALTALAISAVAVVGRLDAGQLSAYPDRIRSAVLPLTDHAAVVPSPALTCHPAYRDCIPHDITNDFDCDDLAITNIRLQNVDWDPYELDRNGDGVGCEGR